MIKCQEKSGKVREWTQMVSKSQEMEFYPHLFSIKQFQIGAFEEPIKKINHGEEIIPFGFNLEYLKSPNFKIFFNHGEGIILFGFNWSILTDPISKFSTMVNKLYHLYSIWSI